MMENVWKILPLFAATLLLLPHMEAQHFAPPHPLCASQFALASYACSLLPTNPVPPISVPSSPPVPSPPEDGEEDDDDDDDDDDDSDDDSDSDDDNNDDDDDSGQASDGGGNGGSGDSGGSSGAGGGGNGGGGSSDDNVVRGGDVVPTAAHGHGRAHSPVHGHAHAHAHHRVRGHGRKKLGHHKRRHKHRHHHKALQRSLSPQEDNCCKWLTQLDNQCVCELLLRLPTFLLKPAHTYSVYIGSSCNITYICPHP